MKQYKGFTLIELLIVVAIIGILAAIAIPNFLNAQVRSKVAKVKAEHAMLATGLESYYVDNNEYPLTVEHTGPFSQLGGGWFAYIGRLSTPIAYIGSAPIDPFIDSMLRPLHPGEPGWDYYEYWSEPSCGFDMVDIKTRVKSVMWLLNSWGPDRDPDGYAYQTFETIYDPTNGTISNGNIYRFGP